MEKLTLEEWEKLSREEKRQALLEFRNPDTIYHPNKLKINETDKGRFL